jgi:hypothetical protein
MSSYVSIEYSGNSSFILSFLQDKDFGFREKISENKIFLKLPTEQLDRLLQLNNLAVDEKNKIEKVKILK